MLLYVEIENQGVLIATCVSQMPVWLGFWVSSAPDDLNKNLETIIRKNIQLPTSEWLEEAPISHITPY